MLPRLPCLAQGSCGNAAPLFHANWALMVGGQGLSLGLRVPVARAGTVAAKCSRCGAVQGLQTQLSCADLVLQLDWWQRTEAAGVGSAAIEELCNDARHRTRECTPFPSSLF